MNTVPVPARIEDIDAGWLDRALGGGVTAARIVKVIHGTATKICVEVDRTPPHTASRHRV